MARVPPREAVSIWPNKRGKYRAHITCKSNQKSGSAIISLTKDWQ